MGNWSGGISGNIMYLVLLAFTVLFYAEIYIIANANGISKLSESEPLGLIAELGLFALAWFFAVRPAIEKLLGKTVTYNARDWKMHATNLLVLVAAAYLGLSEVMAESKDITPEEGSFAMFTVVLFMLVPSYALTAYLVNVIVNGEKMRAAQK